MATIVSVALYQGIFFAGTIKGKPPAPDSSYLAGLATFAIPFLLLVAAEAIGLPRLIARFCVGVGLFALLLVSGLVITNQAFLVVPAVMFTFGFFSAGVLACTAVGLGCRGLSRWMKHRDRRT